MNRKNNGEAQAAQGPAESPVASPRQRPALAALRKRKPVRRQQELTTPDLVVLSLLAEQPMYGYQANRELERREIWDWAEVSRSQVYYSVEKLARMGLLRKLDPRERQARFDRDTFETTEQGREALADALERKEWTTQRDLPAFLTWMAVSWLARPGVFRTQLRKRRKFLLKEMRRERATLMSIRTEVGHRFHEAVWMVSLMTEQLKTEIRWNRQLEQDLKRRARALHPSVFTEDLPK